MNSYEISETIAQDTESKLLKYFDLFVEYVNHPTLYELHENIKLKQNPSSQLIKQLVQDAKKDKKLFQFIEVLLKNF